MSKSTVSSAAPAAEESTAVVPAAIDVKALLAEHKTAYEQSRQQQELEKRERQKQEIAAAVAASRAKAAEYRLLNAEILATIEQEEADGLELLSAEGWRDNADISAAVNQIRIRLDSMVKTLDNGEQEPDKNPMKQVLKVLYSDSLDRMNGVQTYEDLVQICNLLVLRGNLMTDSRLEDLLRDNRDNPDKRIDTFSVAGLQFGWPGNPGALKTAFYGTQEAPGARQRAIQQLTKDPSNISVQDLLEKRDADGRCVVQVEQKFGEGPNAETVESILVLFRRDNEITLQEVHGKLRGFLKDKNTQVNFIGQSWRRGQLPPRLHYLLQNAAGNNQRSSSSNDGGVGTTHVFGGTDFSGTLEEQARSPYGKGKLMTEDQRHAKRGQHEASFMRARRQAGRDQDDEG